MLLGVLSRWTKRTVRLLRQAGLFAPEGTTVYCDVPPLRETTLVVWRPPLLPNTITVAPPTQKLDPSKDGLWMV